MTYADALVASVAMICATSLLICHSWHEVWLERIKARKK